jgi:hypothetical protein
MEIEEKIIQEFSEIKLTPSEKMKNRALGWDEKKAAYYYNKAKENLTEIGRKTLNGEETTGIIARTKQIIYGLLVFVESEKSYPHNGE